MASVKGEIVTRFASPTGVLQANELQWTLHAPVVLLKEPADSLDDTVAQDGCRIDEPSVSSVHIFLPSA